MEHQMLLHWKADELDATLRQTMIEQVIPQIRGVILAAAANVSSKYEPGPFARDIAAEMIIKRLADYLTLSDADEVVRLHMLTDEYTRYWFRTLLGGKNA